MVSFSRPIGQYRSPSQYRGFSKSLEAFVGTKKLLPLIYQRKYWVVGERHVSMVPTNHGAPRGLTRHCEVGSPRRKYWVRLMLQRVKQEGGGSATRVVVGPIKSGVCSSTQRFFLSLLTLVSAGGSARLAKERTSSPPDLHALSPVRAFIAETFLFPSFEKENGRSFLFPSPFLSFRIFESEILSPRSLLLRRASSGRSPAIADEPHYGRHYSGAHSLLSSSSLLLRHSFRRSRDRRCSTRRRSRPLRAPLNVGERRPPSETRTHGRLRGEVAGEAGAELPRRVRHSSASLLRRPLCSLSPPSATSCLSLHVRRLTPLPSTPTPTPLRQLPPSASESVAPDADASASASASTYEPDADAPSPSPCIAENGDADPTLLIQLFPFADDGEILILDEKESIVFS